MIPLTGRSGRPPGVIDALSAGIYAAFFNQEVTVPIGILLLLGLVPTGDLIRLVSRWIERQSPELRPPAE